MVVKMARTAVAQHCIHPKTGGPSVPYLYLPERTYTWLQESFGTKRISLDPCSGFTKNCTIPKLGGSYIKDILGFVPSNLKLNVVTL